MSLYNSPSLTKKNKMLLFLLLALSAEKRMRHHHESSHTRFYHSSSYPHHKTKKIRRSIDGQIIPEKPIKHRIAHIPTRMRSQKASKDLEMNVNEIPSTKLTLMSTHRGPYVPGPHKVPPKLPMI